MITKKQLKEKGFHFSELNDGWQNNKNQRINFSLNEDGSVSFIRENDNYHGVSIKPVYDINLLLCILNFIE